MNRSGRLKGIYRRWGAIALAIAVFQLICGPALAKSTKLDKQTVGLAADICKDREAAFAEDSAMSSEDFQKAWSVFSQRLDDKYAGKQVRLGKYGSHIRIRQKFTLLAYVALLSQSKGVSLEPSIQELVSRHPFMQMLMSEGSCYIRNDRYPKKVADLLAARPQLALMIRQNIDSWEPGYRKAFDETFPVNSANTGN